MQRLRRGTGDRCHPAVMLCLSIVVAMSIIAMVLGGGHLPSHNHNLQSLNNNNERGDSAATMESPPPQLLSDTFTGTFVNERRQMKDRLRVAAIEIEALKRRAEAAEAALAKARSDKNDKGRVDRPATTKPPLATERKLPMEEHLRRTDSSKPAAHRGNNNVKAGQEEEQPKPLLIVGIPTVPRPDDDAAAVPMLVRTLNSFVAQVTASGLQEPNVGGGVGSHLMRVVVMNNRPGRHRGFELAKKEFAEHSWIEFTENDSPLIDDPQATVDPEFAEKNQEPPTPQVRRQTLDVVSLLRRVVGRSRYYLFYEDDFFFCENALMALLYFIGRANVYQGMNRWTALRCGIGLNGIIMQNRGGEATATASTAEHADLTAFEKYLSRHYARRPPDHLAVEWYAKESSEARRYFGGGAGGAGGERHVMAFRYHMFRHDGRHSTLRDQTAWETPMCFVELIAPLVFPVEAWDPVACAHDDVWPCDYPNARPTVMVWNNSSEALVSRHRDRYRSIE